MNLFNQFVILNVANNILWGVLATIVLVLVLGKYCSRILATLVYNVLKKAGRKLNKDAYYNLLITPLTKFIVVSTILVALEKLTLPPLVANYSFYGHVTVSGILNLTSIVLLIIVFIKLLVSVVEYIAIVLHHRASLTATQSDNQLIDFIKDFVKVALIVMGALLILKFGFSQNIGNLLTGLSLVGAAVALATKESLENLIASFIIFSDKPFVTGDEVKVQNVHGTIERIGLRSTRIRSQDKTYVSVPNKQMVDSIVDNQSLRTSNKFSIKLEIDRNAQVNDLQNFIIALKNIMIANNTITEHQIYLAEINKLSNVVQVYYYTQNLTENQNTALKENINYNIIHLLNAHKINRSSEGVVV